MFSPNVPNRQVSSKSKVVKLPQIPSRNKIVSVKKHNLTQNHKPLPSVKLIKSNKNVSVDKQNQNSSNQQRRNSLERNIEASKNVVEMAEKKVQDVLGLPEETVDMGGDLTNFEHKIELNRQLIKRQKNGHLSMVRKDSNCSIGNSENQSNKNKSKNNRCISSSKPMATESNLEELNKLKIKLSENIKPTNGKAEENDSKSHRIDSEKKKKVMAPVQRQKTKQQEGSPVVFKSIQQILDDPQKMKHTHEKEKVKTVKFSISELQEKLKKMDEEHYKTLEHGDRLLTSVKSVGNIPSAGESLTERQQKNKDFLGNSNNIGSCANNFNDEVDCIGKWEKKSHKSIEKMVENRKMLIDLSLNKLRSGSKKILPMVPIDKKVTQREKKALFNQ